LKMKEGTGAARVYVTSSFSGMSTVGLAFDDPVKGVGMRVLSPNATDLRIDPLIRGGFTGARINGVNFATTVRISSGSGDDVVLVDSLHPALTAKLSVDAGAGNDAVILAGDPSKAAKVTAAGGTGFDRIEDYMDVSKQAGTPLTGFEIDASGFPSYTEQGPGPILQSGDMPATGAIQTIAQNGQNIFVGTTNGGIWRSKDNGATWEPLTDALPTLSIGAVTIAPVDNAGAAVTAGTALSKLVVYAGIGTFSSFRNRGGFTLGILKSTDGGST
jgi:hypothetical protein